MEKKYQWSNLDKIRAFFSQSQYPEGSTIPADKERLLDKTPIINKVKSIYLLVNDKEKDFQIHLYELTDLKSNIRGPILRKITNFAGTYFIIFTVDYSEYFLSVVANNRSVTQKFNPNNPNIISIRWLDALADRAAFSPYETLNQMQSEKEYALIAEKIWYVLHRPKYKENLLHVFINAGLKVVSPYSFVVSRTDAPLRAGIQIIAPNTNPNTLFLKRIKDYSSGFSKQNFNDLKMVVFLSNQHLHYFDTHGNCLKRISFEQESLVLKYLESLIACVDNRCAFNAETFCQQFSIHSPIFLYAYFYLENYYKKNQHDLEIIFHEWSLKFEEVYKKEDVREPLFLKHSYLAHIIKTVLYIKYLNGKEKLTNENFLQMADWFEEKNVELFLNDFFAWTLIVDEVNEEIFYTLKDTNFEAEDIFRLIYQELVSPETRSALGEFYTPPALCRLMVEETYKFGHRVLDPACGSGTFLSEIVTLITNADKTDQEKLTALENIYGFDVNPIAVLVSKANLLLHLEFLLNELQIGDLPSYPINIYLCNSLFPIKKRKPVEKGKGIKRKDFPKFAMVEMEEFYMESIDDSILIPKKFFEKLYQNDFEHMLRILDAELTKTADFNQLRTNLEEKIKFKWLFEMEKGMGTLESYWDMFIGIARKFFELSQKKSNHIWIYLLFNMIGVRKVRDERVELIIGNPPWLVLNKIHSDQYKKSIKQLAKELGIMMGGKNASNTEMSSIFFNSCSQLYLKENQRIFFVITNAIMTGNQHSKFRLFNDFSKLSIWQFEEDVFRIHNICLSGFKYSTPLEERLKVLVHTIKSSKINNNWNFSIEPPQIFVPYNYESVKKDELAFRLVPLNQLKTLLPRGENPYYDRFYRGADAFPRNLLFVNISKTENEIAIVSPNMSLQKQKPWDFKPFDTAKIELKYIFQLVKSTELVPFAILGKFDVFFPIERDDYLYDPERIASNAKNHFKKINELYQNHQKGGAAITDLWERIDFQKGLSKPNQRAKIKVVYNGTGTLVKSAIVSDENTIIDTKLYYISIQLLEEAYYLMGILNAPCISEDMQFRGGTGAGGGVREIHKRPLDLKIPQYNSRISLHKEIVQKSQELEQLVKVIIKDWTEKERLRIEQKKKEIIGKNSVNSSSKVRILPMTIQNRIYSELKEEFISLNYLIKNLLKGD